jgi:hypothetical protein
LELVILVRVQAPEPNSLGSSENAETTPLEFRWKFQQTRAPRLQNLRTSPKQRLELAIGKNSFDQLSFFLARHEPSADRFLSEANPLSGRLDLEIKRVKKFDVSIADGFDWEIP